MTRSPDADVASRDDAALRSHWPTVAYQGIVGSYGEEAVRRLWQCRARTYPKRSFAAALDALSRGGVEWAVIPIWNSTIGTIVPARAAMLAHERAVACIQEIDLPVKHCLLARAGTSIDDVRFVGSHPAALAQCAMLFSDAPRLTACDAIDTAVAARDLAQYGRRDTHESVEHATADTATDRPWYAGLAIDSPAQLAVIASRRAAQRYGLNVLAFDVQDDPANVTRFAALRAARRSPAEAIGQ
jgi:prephenate dehydratase